MGGLDIYKSEYNFESSGSAETMLDDSKRFVEKAKAAKVDIQIEVWKDMFHGWHGSAHILVDAQMAINSIAVFCRRLFSS